MRRRFPTASDRFAIFHTTTNGRCTFRPHLHDLRNFIDLSIEQTIILYSLFMGNNTAEPLAGSGAQGRLTL